jgi:hypothetical protein
MVNTQPVIDQPGDTASHPAVTATSPARAPLRFMLSVGFLYFSQMHIMVDNAPPVAAINTWIY